MNNWYILYNGQQIGPMNENALLAYNPTPNTMVWQEGMPEWQPIYMFPNLMDKLNSKNGGGVPPMYNTARTDKDKLAAGLLAIFLGSLGIQYFYLGKTSGGIICLLLTIVTCGIYGLYWLYRAGDELDRQRAEQGQLPGHLGILYLLLSLFGFTIVSYALLQSELNGYAAE